MKTLILSIALLATLGAQAGIFDTIVQIPKRTVEATATVVEDVVTAPEDIVKDTASIPAKAVGAVPTEKQVKTETPAVTQEAQETAISNKLIEPKAELTEPEVKPFEETTETQIFEEEIAPVEPMGMEDDIIEANEVVE